MNKNKGRIGAGLAWAGGIYLLAGMVFLFFTGRERDVLTTEIGRQKIVLQEVKIKASVDEEELNDLEARYLWGLSRYREDHTFYSFNHSVKEELERAGMNVIRYERQDRDGEEFMEFSAEGRIESYFLFLNRFYNASRAFKIPYFYLEKQPGGCRITFLIGFSLIDDDLKQDIPLTEGYDWSLETGVPDRIEPSLLVEVFGEKRVRTSAAPPKAGVAEAPVTAGDIRSFEYIGKVSLDNRMKYYVKDRESGRIITIPSPGWELIGAGENRLEFKSEGMKYGVSIR